MAKKKSSKASQEKTASSLKEALGLDKIFYNERINFVVGFCLLFIAGYLIWAFASFFVTGEADQSIIEAPREGELLNQNGEFQNACGSLGAYVSWFFIKRCFGLAAFLVPMFLVLVSLNMMRAYKVNLLKWFMCLAIIMIWASITMAKFLAPLFANTCFNPGGDHGLAVCQQIEGLIGTPGLTAVLALTAIAFLVYLSMETVIILRKIFNPLHYLKKIPMEIHIGKGDSEDSPSASEGIQTLEDPTVFDDPQAETVEFKMNDDEAIISNTPTESNEPVKPAQDAAPIHTGDVVMTVDTGEKEEEAEGKDLVGEYGDISTPYDPKRDLENYRYPTLDLLKKYESDGKPFIDMGEQNAKCCATSVSRFPASRPPSVPPLRCTR